jgi:hypothetical protein
VYNNPCIFYPNLEQASATVNDHLPEAVPRLLGQRIKKTRPRNQFVKETLDVNRDPRSPDTALQVTSPLSTISPHSHHNVPTHRQPSPMYGISRHEDPSIVLHIDALIGFQTENVWSRQR